MLRDGIVKKKTLKSIKINTNKNQIIESQK